MDEYSSPVLVEPAASGNLTDIIVGNAEQADQAGAGKHGQPLPAFLEHHSEERELTRDEQGRGEARQHGCTTEPGRRDRVHIAVADLGHRSPADRDAARHWREQVSDSGRDKEG